MSSNYLSSHVGAESTVNVQLSDGVFRIVLNQPESRNALSRSMIESLIQALDAAVRTAEARLVIFAATGKAFCAGGNLGNVSARLAEPPDTKGRDPIALGNRLYGRFLEQLAQCPKPTVALVQGAAMGGGAGLVCATDIAIGVRGAKFGFPETSIGLVPAQILPFVANRIGTQHARRMMLTGERIEADEAFRIGLLDYIEDNATSLSARMDEVAQLLKRGGPQALANTKTLLRTAFGLEEWQERGLSDYLDRASEMFANQFRSEAQEGIEAARARRAPAW